MENRWSLRTPISLSVMIHYGPLGLINAVAKDISDQGMFIETGRITLQSNETIELTFQNPNSLENEVISLTANIVHCNEKGAGINFLNYSLSPYGPEYHLKYASTIN